LKNKTLPYSLAAAVVWGYLAEYYQRENILNKRYGDQSESVVLYSKAKETEGVKRVRKHTTKKHIEKTMKR
jgi:hypothetical protein